LRSLAVVAVSGWVAGVLSAGPVGAQVPAVPVGGVRVLMV